jgi:hypothetical protein
MGVMHKGWYREEARKRHGKDRGKDMKQDGVEVDENCDVSVGEAPGGWVQAWVWVPDPATEAPAKREDDNAGLHQAAERNDPVRPELPEGEPGQ